MVHGFQPETSNPRPQTLNPKAKTSNPKPKTLWGSWFSTRILEPYAANPEPQAQNLEPQTPKFELQPQTCDLNGLEKERFADDLKKYCARPGNNANTRCLSCKEKIAMQQLETQSHQVCARKNIQPHQKYNFEKHM